MQCTYCQVKFAFELLPDLVQFGVTKGVACHKTEECVNISVGFCLNFPREENSFSKNLIEPTDS